MGSAAELRSIADPENDGTGFASTAAANGGTAATAVTLTAADSLVAHYVQLADITLCDDATNTTDCDPFAPIGNDYTDASSNTDTPFSGSYDGGGNEIIGLRVDSEVTGAPEIDAWGLFGLVGGATAEIRNVMLQSPAVTGTELVGTLVGSLTGDTTIADSAAVGGMATATASAGVSTGGLVGLIGSTGTIQNSYATNTVNGGDGDFDYGGGLVGSIIDEGTIQNSHATGAVNGGNGANDRSGGLVGFVSNEATIQNSYATGAVNGGNGDFDVVGGLIGITNSTGTIRNNYATGAVNGGNGDSDNVGGLIGFVISNPTIQNNYATGAVDGGEGDDNIGGLVGGVFTTTNSYHSGANTDTGDDFNDSGEERTLAQLQCPIAPNVPCNGTTTYTGWSRADWDFGTAGELPSVIGVGTNRAELPGQPVTP